jgi:peptide/nickel transport system ATP-binding protein
MIFQEPMTSLNPVLTIGFQITEVADPASRHVALGSRAETVRLLDKVRIPSAKSRFGISAPLLRRHAPARRDRDRARLRTEAADRRRADDRARRDDPGADPGADQDAAGGEGMSVLFITHDMGVVAEISDRTVVMYNGEAVETGTTQDIFASAPNIPIRARCCRPCRSSAR